MKNSIIEFNKSQRSGKYPEFKAGDVIKVHRKIKEGEKERIQIFEGIIISIKGGQSSSPMITVRKVSQGIGVELVLPVFSPNIDKIEVVKTAKVRRAKLYYLRGLTAKKSRMKYKSVAEFVPAKSKEEVVEDSEPVSVEATTAPEEKVA